MAKTTFTDGIFRRTKVAETIYVTAAGDDNDSGGVSDPLRQPQAAINLLKQRASVIEHAVVINIGSGTFNGFALEGVLVGAGSSGEGSLTIQGALAAPTLTTGTASGTATGGSTTTLTDSGQSWTVDELIGALVLVGSEYRVVYDNDATSITFASAFSSTTSGQAYSIVEPKTVLNTVDGLVGDSVVYVAGCTTNWRKNFVFKNLDIQAPASTFAGFFAFETAGFQFRDSRVSCASAGSNGVLAQSISGEYSIEDIYAADDFDVAGANLSYNGGACRALRVLSDGLDGKGLALQYCNRIEGVDATADGCGSNGLSIYGCGSVVISRAVLASSGSHGLKVDNSWVSMANVSGTGNAGHGASILPRSYILTSGIPTITGSSGDATDDRGTSSITWATDLANNGDLTSNTDYMVTIERQD